MVKKAYYKVDVRVDEDFIARLEIVKQYEKEKRGTDTESHAISLRFIIIVIK